MLQNAYFLAKIGVDTAENEQHFAEILPICRRVVDSADHYVSLRGNGTAADPADAGRRAAAGSAGRWAGAASAGRWAAAGSAGSPVGDTTGDRQNFGKMLLVFGCIDSDFCKKICVLQHFSKSTRFSS